MLSNGTGAREIVARHRLVDDRHARAALVLEVEIAAGEERSSDGLKVLGRNPIYGNIAAILRPFLMAFHSCETRQLPHPRSD